MTQAYSYYRKIESAKSEIARCPECGNKAQIHRLGVHFYVKCLANTEHWRGPVRIIEADAIISWNSVVDCYWQTKVYGGSVSKKT